MQQQQSRAKPGQMVINRPSLVQDVKLRTAENAWKPASKVETVTNDSEEVETQVDCDTISIRIGVFNDLVFIQKLYKKVRGILNRITPQTFEELLGEYFALNINDETRLKGVIDIFFDKTVEEPNYCSMYGKFCHAVCQVDLKN